MPGSKGNKSDKKSNTKPPQSPKDQPKKGDQKGDEKQGAPPNRGREERMQGSDMRMEETRQHALGQQKEKQ